MLCKLCNKEIVKRFGIHLNGHHKSWNLKKYFEHFPEQKLMYIENKTPNWAKGKNKNTDSRLKDLSLKLKEYNASPDIRNKKSQNLKDRYAKGDILNHETRVRVTKCASDGWLNRLNRASEEEKKELLKPMHEGAKNNKRKTFQHLELEEYMNVREI